MFHDLTDRLLSFFLDNAGAVSAGVASVVGPAAAIASQVPIAASGVDPELVAFIMAVGPPLTWFFFRVLKSLGEYFSVVDKKKRERAIAFLNDSNAANDLAAGTLLDEADRAAALAAAFKMVSRKKGDSDEQTDENEKAK